MLGKTLRHHKSVRAARRWQTQKSVSILLANNLNGQKVPNAIVNGNFNGYKQLDNKTAKPKEKKHVITYTPNTPNVN